ncbi:MAG TPA: MMPL family transporter, partial [Thermoanaerobaculia bacterium]|nr:MMPL family transporter [Thermoanaerobaculia bacterium]
MSPETPGRSPGRLGRLWARWRREPGEGAGQRGLGEAQIEALLRFSVAHPRWVVALSLALAVVSLLGLPRIHPRLDGRSLIPAGHPSLAASDAAAREFHLRDVLVVGLADPQGGIYQPHHLELLRRLSHGIANIPGVVPGSVASLATLPRLAIEADTLDTTPLLAGSGATSPETAARLRRETASLGLDDGLLVTPDGQATAIVAEVTDGADRYQVLGDLRRVLATAGSEGAEVFLSGTALAQATLGLAAARDLAKLVPGVILVLAVVLMVVFRHPVPALASLAEIGVSLTSTVGLLALSREPIFGITPIAEMLTVLDQPESARP